MADEEIKEFFREIGLKDSMWPDYTNINDFSASLKASIVNNVEKTNKK